MIAWLQKKYALSQQGAKDLVKGCFACLLQNLSFMVPAVSPAGAGWPFTWRAA